MTDYRDHIRPPVRVEIGDPQLLGAQPGSHEVTFHRAASSTVVELTTDELRQLRVAITERLSGRGAALPHCPTPCDADCEQICHEVHEIPSKRGHDPKACVAAVSAADVAAERERIATRIERIAASDPRWYTDRFTAQAIADLIRKETPDGQ